MADIKNTKDFIKAIEEVRSEYPEDALEKKIPTSFIATVAATSFDDPKASVRAFINLITTDDRYKDVRESTDKIENMFQGMSPYAENPNYINLLTNVYNDRIKPIIETENMLVPKRKPMNQQMDYLQ
jgi:hypothetical protein